MRILWLSHLVPYPPKGGALQRSHHLLRLAAERFEVHLVAFNQRALLPDRTAMEAAAAAIRPWLGSLAIEPIPADRSRAAWYAVAGRALVDSRPFDELWLQSSRVRAAVAAATAKVGPFDLIHVDTLGMWQYRPREPAAVVLNHHNVESQLMGRRAENESRPLHRAYFKREARKLATVEAYASTTSAINLVVSSLDADRLRTVAPHALTAVVPNGVDVDYFTPGDQERHNPETLLFVGSMGWFPNAEAAAVLARDIWPLLRNADPALQLVLVGPNPPHTLLLAARDDDRLLVTGMVPDVRPYFEQAIAFVCPMRDGGGTRLKILDALAMKCPVVATPMAVEGLGLQPDRHFLAANSPTQFRAQILRLRTEPGLRSRLREEGRTLVAERYSWSVIGHQLVEAYQEARDRHEAATGRPARRPGHHPPPEAPWPPRGYMNDRDHPEPPSQADWNTVPAGSQPPRPRVLYIMAGPRPPEAQVSSDPFYHLSEVATGDVLQPVWWRSSDDAVARLGSFPTFQVGEFKYHLYLLQRLPAGLRPIGKLAYYIRQGLRLSAHRRFDIIATYGVGTPGLAAMILKALTGARILLELNGVPRRAFAFDADVPLLQRKARSAIAHVLLSIVGRAADHFRLLYPTQLAAYPSLARRPHSVIHAWVPIARIRPVGPTGTTILFLGHPWFLKGVDVLIAAFRKAHASIPEYKLRIVGYFPDRERLVRLAAGCDGIEILPPVHYAEAIKLIEDCCFLVLPSRTEAMGRVLLEAMAAAKPVVASNVDGIPHYVTDGVEGLLVPPDDVRALAAALATLANNKRLQVALGTAGRRRVCGELDERTFVQAYDQLFRAMTKTNTT